MGRLPVLAIAAALLAWVSLVTAVNVLHLSDVHLNLGYSPTAPIGHNCVPANATSQPSAEWVFDEQSSGSSGLACPSSTRYESATMGCDPSPALVESAFAQMAASGVDGFVVMTGDFASHGLSDAGAVTSAISATTRLMRAAFGATPVLPAIGNDDCSPDYDMPLPPASEAWLTTLWGLWAPWLAQFPGAQASFILGGYYEAEPLPGLRVLALNTIYYATVRPPALALDADPAGQFAWLAARLDAARAASARVWVIGHIPPAMSVFAQQPMWNATYAAQYVALVADYADVIVAQLFGHTHRDEYRVLTVGERDAWVPMLVAGGVSPVYCNNPSFRLLNVLNGTFIVQDYSQTFFDLETGALTWALEYTFGQAYQINGAVTADSLALLYTRLVANQSELAAYVSRQYAFVNAGPVTDRLVQLCALTVPSFALFQRCVATGELPVLDPPPRAPSGALSARTELVLFVLVIMAAAVLLGALYVVLCFRMPSVDAGYSRIAESAA